MLGVSIVDVSSLKKKNNNMAIIGISYDGGKHYDDDDNKVGECPTYESINLRVGEKKYQFKTDNFVKDWYDMRKMIINGEIVSDTIFWSLSSTVNHFIMDGAPYDSAYLHIIDGVPILKYFDTSDPNWWMDSSFEEGIEFFVPENTKPTWEELRELCNDKKK